MKDQDFFVGYLPASPSVRGLALAVALALSAGFAILAIGVGRSGADIGPSSYGEEISVEGVLVARPYPMVVTAPDAANPKGRTVLLGGEGKRGAAEFGLGLDGKSVKLEGISVKRGDIEMALISAPAHLAPIDRATPAQRAEPLGRWRIAGEICDGKCAAGGMRPGTGLAHKACANLCVSGGLPPILVSAATAAGGSFFLLGAEDGGPVPTAVYDLMAAPVVLEGELFRHGDLLVYLVDWRAAKRH